MTVLATKTEMTDNFRLWFLQLGLRVFLLHNLLQLLLVPVHHRLCTSHTHPALHSPAIYRVLSGNGNDRIHTRTQANVAGFLRGWKQVTGPQRYGKNFVGFAAKFTHFVHYSRAECVSCQLIAVYVGKN